MSAYSVKGKGWRYDFTHKGVRHTEAWFKTKKEAQRAEALKREEVLNPPVVAEATTDTGFLELVNLRLDHVKAYNSASHYRDYRYMARRWVSLWGKMDCNDVTSSMIEKFVLKRNKISAYTANKEIRYLRATFNFGKKKKLINCNPVDGIDFLPINKKVKYVPNIEDIEKVIRSADSGTQDYLIALCDTMARVGEINQLCWSDVELDKRYLVLYTRKKKGGHRTPRKVPMTDRLFAILRRRFSERNLDYPWVFWHSYYEQKTQTRKVGPYDYRKRLLKSLCEKAGVAFFSFHALRHAGATIMENNNVPIGSIQRLLGHENRSTTEIYLHSLGTGEFDAVRTLERARLLSHTKSHTE